MGSFREDSPLTPLHPTSPPLFPSQHSPLPYPSLLSSLIPYISPSFPFLLFSLSSLFILPSLSSHSLLSFPPLPHVASHPLFLIPPSFLCFSSLPSPWSLFPVFHSSSTFFTLLSLLSSLSLSIEPPSLSHPRFPSPVFPSFAFLPCYHPITSTLPSLPFYPSIPTSWPSIAPPLLPFP